MANLSEEEDLVSPNIKDIILYNFQQRERHGRPCRLALQGQGGMPTPPIDSDRPLELPTPRSFTASTLERAELERLPAIVVADGPGAMRRFAEFFSAHIRNR